MNYPLWKLCLDMAQAFGTIGVGLYVWWTNREKVTAARFVKLEQQVIDRVSTAVFESHQTRLNTAESNLRNVPACCTGHPAMEQRMDGHNGRLAQHKELIDQLAGDVKHLPKTADLERVHNRVDQVFRLADNIQGEIKGMARNMDILLEHHLKGS